MESLRILGLRGSSQPEYPGGDQRPGSTLRMQLTGGRLDQGWTGRRQRGLTWGCSLHRASTPTVMRITSSLRLSRIRLMTPASPASAHVRRRNVVHALAGAAHDVTVSGRGSQP